MIGMNGTGKTTILKALAVATRGLGPGTSTFSFLNGLNLAQCIVGLNDDGTSVYHGLTVGNPIWNSVLAVYCPSEGDGSFNPTSIDPGRITLDRALTSLGAEVYKHVVSNLTAGKFWERIVAHIKRRESEYFQFQRLPECRDLTISEIDEIFDRSHPKVLEQLANIWNGILHLAYLEFDWESASIPIQLKDTFKAYIRTRNKAGSQTLKYAELSTGIRHYLFRLGHIWSLYFDRPQSESVVFVDEPEGSLYPDFLYDIVSTYQTIAPGAQIFMATHSPIVAAQFKPEERFILSFDDNGKLLLRRGTSPEGDDPNDLLVQDFGVSSLMTEAGEEAWRRFLELRRKIPLASADEREGLVEEYSRLGTEYHFPQP